MMYPIAERFKSVQGEGQWAGTRMAFVRLAGCTVGRPFTHDKPEGLEVYQERCTLWDGRTFACDTNYKKHEALSVGMILNWIDDEERVCITGGEPLMHNLYLLLEALYTTDKIVHMETSGTIDIDEKTRRMIGWLAVSPKQGVLPEMLKKADEVKVLVDDDFSIPAMQRDILPYVPEDKLWFQPVNELHTVNDHNLGRCLRLQEQFRQARLSSQLHKWWHVL